MYLFFDVEAIGFPKKWNLPHTDTFNWPRMVQIAWILTGEDQQIIEAEDYIIKPEGFEIPYESERLTKISTDRAMEEGADLKTVLESFVPLIDRADYVLGHNMNFNEKVLGAELIRKNIGSRLFNSERYCIMQESTWFCKLPGKGGRYKWPTLNELHQVLFGEKAKGLNNAKVDVELVAKCSFKLLELEAMELF